MIAGGLSAHRERHPEFNSQNTHAGLREIVGMNAGQVHQQQLVDAGGAGLVKEQVDSDQRRGQDSQDISYCGERRRLADR